MTKYGRIHRHINQINNIRQHQQQYLIKQKQRMLFKQLIKNTFATLVLAQHNGKKLSSNTMKVLSAANKLKDKQHILVFAENEEQVVASIKQSVPAEVCQKIIVAKTKRTLSDQVSNIVSQLHEKYKYKNIVGLSSSFGKDVIPRIAGKYMSQPITDVLEVSDEKTFVRSTYAGNALTKVRSAQDVNFLTFRASSFEEMSQGKNDAEVEVVNEPQEKLSEFVREEKSDSNKPDLTTARIVISGGRGLKSKENFSLVYALADAFGNAAVGASRAAVDSGYCPNQMQVGQTGKVVAPELYIACGISGAVQHLAGMKDSKVIVAINNRPDEPIFELANYGLEADLFKALPELTQKIKKLKQA